MIEFPEARVAIMFTEIPLLALEQEQALKEFRVGKRPHP